MKRGKAAHSKKNKRKSGDALECWRGDCGRGQQNERRVAASDASGLFSAN